ncbi:hypothetical protein CP972_19010 [Streptomyces prasinus]|uniref:Uncharacterized protein n=1 Tax=Streptomyces prasinus TaxID=67345 RepID=A0ABX6AXI7_9ACTN|nr:hypothetical protein CP972_19010 [Streptomyces prasinus]
MIDSWPPALSTSGRASAQRGRSGPEAGASPAAEPGSAPGGAERSRGSMKQGKSYPAGISCSCATGDHRLRLRRSRTPGRRRRRPGSSR